MTNQVVVFNNHNLDIVSKNGQAYLTAPQIGAALGYSRPDKINSIYQSHRDEFTDTMTDTTETVVSGNLTKTTRIFSLRGCHLLAMFSKTPVAKEFRRWVLDLIENHNQLSENIVQLPQVQVDMKAIGGMVKRCAAV